jgi:hypothetical protein
MVGRPASIGPRRNPLRNSKSPNVRRIYGGLACIDRAPPKLTTAFEASPGRAPLAREGIRRPTTCNARTRPRLTGLDRRSGSNTST